MVKMKLCRCWTHDHIGQYVLNMTWVWVIGVLVLFLLTLSWVIYLAQVLKKKEKKHTIMKPRIVMMQLFQGRFQRWSTWPVVALMKALPPTIFSFWKISIARTTNAYFLECGWGGCKTAQLNGSLCQRGWSWCTTGGWSGRAWRGSRV